MMTDEQPIRSMPRPGKGSARLGRRRAAIARPAGLAIALVLLVALVACSGPATATPTLAPRATVAPTTAPTTAPGASASPVPPTPTILVPLVPTATVVGGGGVESSNGWSS